MSAARLCAPGSDGTFRRRRRPSSGRSGVYRFSPCARECKHGLRPHLIIRGCRPFAALDQRRHGVRNGGGVRVHGRQHLLQPADDGADGARCRRAGDIRRLHRHRDSGGLYRGPRAARAARRPFRAAWPHPARHRPPRSGAARRQRRAHVPAAAAFGLSGRHAVDRGAIHPSHGRGPQPAPPARQRHRRGDGRLADGHPGRAHPRRLRFRHRGLAGDVRDRGRDHDARRRARAVHLSEARGDIVAGLRRVDALAAAVVAGPARPPRGGLPRRAGPRRLPHVLGPAHPAPPRPRRAGR